jgi:hypothetical protein
VSRLEDDAVNALREDASDRDDWMTLALCRLATEGERYVEPGHLTPSEAEQIAHMTPEQARTALDEQAQRAAHESGEFCHFDDGECDDCDHRRRMIAAERERDLREDADHFAYECARDERLGGGR